jgi:glycosyltransferase involved in cell wall biosynthesis
MSASMPTISCLMVTRNRFDWMLKSIACYEAQDYPKRELLVVADSSAQDLERISELLRGVRRSDIHTIFVDGPRTLGSLRNLAVSRARGSVVCQWDDDDLHHPAFLSTLYCRLKHERADAVFMVDQLHLFCDTCDLYWTDWYPNRLKYPRRHGPHLIPGTLMALKVAMPEYPDWRSGEDNVVKIRLCRWKRVTELRGRPWLQVYTYHGLNTWSRIHHERITHWAAVDCRRFRPAASTLASALGEYPTGVLPQTLRMVGRDGPVGRIRSHARHSARKVRANNSATPLAFGAGGHGVQKLTQRPVP